MNHTILIFSDWFPPAYKAGGPIRSTENFVRHLSSYYKIYVFTGSSDLNEKEPLQGIVGNKWLKHESGANVFYASPGLQTLKEIWSIIREVAPDFIYLNSMFSLAFSIYPLIIRKMGMGDGKIILSPRGMLKPSALAFKAGKKKLFINLLKLTGTIKRATFLATDDKELAEIRAVFPEAAIFTAPNFPGRVSEPRQVLKKHSGELRMIFIGRIHPIKNLAILLSALLHVKGIVQLTIAGLLEDSDYWRACGEIIKRFPATHQLDFVGDLPHHQLEDILTTHHVLSLPTKGENFGHAIFEALAMGKPVIISDQTPWRELQNKNAGWDLPLQQEEFTNAIQQAVNWDQDTYTFFSNGAFEVAQQYIHQSNLAERYKQIFQ